MYFLVVKKHMRSECLQHGVFRNSTEEESRIDSHSPFSKGSDDALVCRAVASGDYCNPNGRFLRFNIPLESTNGLEKFGKWSLWKWSSCVLSFMLEEGIKSLFLVNLLGFFRKQNSICIKSYANPL